MLSRRGSLGTPLHDSSDSGQLPKLNVFDPDRPLQILARQ